MRYAQEFAQSMASNPHIAKLLVLSGIDAIESEDERRVTRALYERLEQRFRLQEGPGIAAVIGGFLGLVPLFIEAALLTAQNVMMPSLFHSLVWALSMIFTFCAVGAGLGWLVARIFYYNAKLRQIDATLRELCVSNEAKIHLSRVLREHEPRKFMLLEQLSSQAV